MKHYIATAFAASALLAAPAWAQEFGAAEEAAPAEEPSPIQQILDSTSDLAGKPLGSDYVATMETLGDDSVEQEEDDFKAPMDLLGEYLEEKGITLGWDEKKGRVIAAAEVEFDAEDPEVSDAFLDERSVRMDQLLIRAKAEVIKFIKSEMSASRMLEIPGNPLSKKFDPQLAAMSKDLRAAYVALKRAKVDMDFEVENQKTYSPEQIAAFAESIVGKFADVENGNLAAELDAKKKEAVAAARKKVTDVQASVDSIQQQIAEELERIKGSVSQSSESSIEVSSQMVVLGGSVLKQAEGYNPDNGKYYIAVVYYWSRDLQRAAASILTGTSVEFAKGKKNLAMWLAGKKKSGEYAWMLGPRSFVDDEGSMRLLGFASYPETDNTTKNIQNKGTAELRARAEVGYSIFADAYSHEKSMVKARDKVIGASKSEFEMESEYTAQMGEAFKNITISGLGPVSTPASVTIYGLKARVVAMGVDAGASSSLKDIFKQSELLGIDVRKASARQRGEDDALRAAATAAQDDAASYAAGQAAGQKAVADHEREQAAKKAPKPAPKGNLAPAAKPAPKKPAQPGRITGGSRLIGDDDEEDF